MKFMNWYKVSQQNNMSSLTQAVYNALLAVGGDSFKIQNEFNKLIAMFPVSNGSDVSLSINQAVSMLQRNQQVSVAQQQLIKEINDFVFSGENNQQVQKPNQNIQQEPVVKDQPETSTNPT